MNFFSRLNSRAPYYDDNDDGDDIRKIFKMHHMYHTTFFKEILFFTCITQIKYIILIKML